jgi:hypothetical protein
VDDSCVEHGPRKARPEALAAAEDGARAGKKRDRVHYLGCADFAIALPDNLATVA